MIGNGVLSPKRRDFSAMAASLLWWTKLVGNKVGWWTRYSLYLSARIYPKSAKNPPCKHAKLFTQIKSEAWGGTCYMSNWWLILRYAKKSVFKIIYHSGLTDPWAGLMAVPEARQVWKLRYESSTHTSKQLSSPIFQSLSVCSWGIGNTWPYLHFF